MYLRNTSYLSPQNIPYLSAKRPMYLCKTSSISSQYIPYLSAINLPISTTKNTVGCEKALLYQEFGTKMQPPPEK